MNYGRDELWSIIYGIVANDRRLRFVVNELRKSKET